MRKILPRLLAVLVLTAGGLAIFVRGASRDVPPPDEAEFRAERPEVAPEDNACTYFLQATNLLVEMTNRSLVVDFRMGKTLANAELCEWVDKNEAGLALVKRGTECAICLTPPVETIATPTPYVTPWLHMEEILETRARLARVEGRFAAAADDLAVGMRFGDLVQKDAASLIAYLVGVAMFSSAAEQALDLTRDPAVSPEALERLATELERTGPFAGGLAQALKAEQRIACTVVDDLRGKQEQMALSACIDANANRAMAWLRNARYFFKPNQTKRDLAAVHRLMIGNAARTHADMERFDLAEKEGGRWAFLRPNAIGDYIFQMMMPSEKVVEMKCRTDSLLAGAKLTVAGNRFARDRGRWPETPAELVPDFLTEVPRDPYDGKPFRYSEEKGVVWAVGTNLTDEGGSTRVPGSEKEYEARRDRRRAEDVVFELKPMEKTE